MQCHAAYSPAFSAHFLFSFHPFAQRGSSKVAALLTWAAKCILHSAFCRCKILAWALPGAQTTTQLDLRQDDSERRGKSWKSSLSSQNFGACCPPFFFCSTEPCLSKQSCQENGSAPQIFPFNWTTRAAKGVKTGKHLCSERNLS